MAWSDSVFIPCVAPVGVSKMDKWLFDVESFMNFTRKGGGSRGHLRERKFYLRILDFDEDFET